MGAAEAGKSMFTANLYDGSDKGEKFYDTNAIIGPRAAPGSAEVADKVSCQRRQAQRACLLAHCHRLLRAGRAALRGPPDLRARLPLLRERGVLEALHRLRRLRDPRRPQGVDVPRRAEVPVPGTPVASPTARRPTSTERALNLSRSRRARPSSAACAGADQLRRYAASAERTPGAGFRRVGGGRGRLPAGAARAPAARRSSGPRPVSARKRPSRWMSSARKASGGDDR